MAAPLISLLGSLAPNAYDLASDVQSEYQRGKKKSVAAGLGLGARQALVGPMTNAIAATAPVVQGVGDAIDAFASGTVNAAPKPAAAAAPAPAAIARVAPGAGVENPGGAFAAPPAVNGGAPAAATASAQPSNVSIRKMDFPLMTDVAYSIVDGKPVDRATMGNEFNASERLEGLGKLYNPRSITVGPSGPEPIDPGPVNVQGRRVYGDPNGEINRNIPNNGIAGHIDASGKITWLPADLRTPALVDALSGSLPRNAIAQLAGQNIATNPANNSRAALETAQAELARAQAVHQQAIAQGLGYDNQGRESVAAMRARLATTTDPTELKTLRENLLVAQGKDPKDASKPEERTMPIYDLNGIKVGERLLERQRDGAWKDVTPSMDPESDPRYLAIKADLAAGKIKPTEARRQIEALGHKVGPPPEAIAFLKANAKRAGVVQEFDAKYGAGAAQAALGGR